MDVPFIRSPLFVPFIRAVDVSSPLISDLTDIPDVTSTITFDLTDVVTSTITFPEQPNDQPDVPEQPPQ